MGLEVRTARSHGSLLGPPICPDAGRENVGTAIGRVVPVPVPVPIRPTATRSQPVTPDHGHHAGPGPLADASVRRARPNDAPAVGMVQATVFREAYAGRLPDEVVALFEPDAFARAWRESLSRAARGRAPPARRLRRRAGRRPGRRRALAGPGRRLRAGGGHRARRPPRRPPPGPRLAPAQRRASTSCARPAPSRSSLLAARRRRGRAGVPHRLGLRPGRRLPRPGRLPRRGHPARGAARRAARRGPTA